MEPLCTTETADTLAEFITVFGLGHYHDVDFWPASGIEHVQLRRPGPDSTDSPTWLRWDRMRPAEDAIRRPITASRAPRTSIVGPSEGWLRAERDDMLSFASRKITESIMSLGAPSRPLNEHFFSLQIMNEDESDPDHPTVRFWFRPADHPPLLNSSAGSIFLRLPGGKLEMILTDAQASDLDRRVEAVQTGKVDPTGFTNLRARLDEYNTFRRESRRGGATYVYTT